MIAFAIWSIVALVFMVIAISSWNSNEVVGFFNVGKAPDIPKCNIVAYNHSVAIIWIVFSTVLEILGIPLLLFEQNSPFFIVTILGTIFLLIGIIIAYLKVEKHYMEK